MRLGRTAFYHFGSQLVVSAAGFAATFLIAYLGGSDALGRYAIAIGIGFFWLVVPGDAVAKSITKRMSEGSEVDEYLGAGVALNTILAVALAVTTLVGARILGTAPGWSSEFSRVLVAYDAEIALLVVTGIVFKTVVAALQGRKEVVKSGGVTAIERVGRTLFQAAALGLGYGVGALVLGHAGSVFFSAIGAVLMFGLAPTVPARRHILRIGGYAKYSWIGAMRSRAFNWVDTIVLSFFVSASLIGIYEAAWGVASLLAVASGSISKTLFPEISELSTQEDYERIIHYLDEGLAFSGIVAIPGLFGAAIVGERVLRFYRPEFGRGATILVLLVAAYLCNIYAQQLVNVIDGIDRPDLTFRINSAFIGANVVLNFVLISLIGWHGAAVATVLSTGLRTVCAYLVLRSLIGELSVPTRQFVHQILASVAMTLTLWPVTGNAPAGRAVTVLLVLAGALVYIVILVVISGRVRDKARGLALAVI